MNTRTLVPGLAATAALATAATLVATSGTPTTAAPAAAVEPTVLTFEVTEDGYTEKYLDWGRKGPSIGDRHLTGLSIARDGQIAGRVLVECVATDRVYEGQTCALAVQLADGTIFLEGMGFHEEVPNVGSGDDSVYAITGGSGTYAGARGEASSPADGTTITVSLLP